MTNVAKIAISQREPAIAETEEVTFTRSSWTISLASFSECGVRTIGLSRARTLAAGDPGGYLAALQPPCYQPRLLGWPGLYGMPWRPFLRGLSGQRLDPKRMKCRK